MFGVITQELQNSNVSKKNNNNKVCVLVLGFQDHFINRSATQQNANYRSLIEGQNVYNVNQSTTICIRTIVFLISFHWWTCCTLCTKSQSEALCTQAGGFCIFQLKLKPRNCTACSGCSRHRCQERRDGRRKMFTLSPQVCIRMRGCCRERWRWCWCWSFFLFF